MPTPKRPLPSMRDLEASFRRKFGRDLTETERKFWYLAEEALEDEALEEELKTAASA